MRLTYTLFAVLLACGRPKPVEQADIARVALKQLFLTRERAHAVALWRDATVTLSLPATLASDAAPRLALDSATLALPVPTRAEDRASMDAFFRANPKGWDAWFIANPASAGLIEVAEPRVHDNDATIVVGRACGEHCRNAWRLTLKRIRHEWVVQAIDVLPVPKGST